MVTDPKLGLTRIHARPMGAVLDLLTRLGIGREDTVGDLARLQVDDVETGMLAEANIGPSIGAVDGVGEYPGLTDGRNGLEYLAIACPKLSQCNVGPKINVFSVNAGYAVVGPLIDRDLIDLFAIGGIDHDEPVLFGAPPPTGWGIDSLAVGGDAGPVAALLELGLPIHLFSGGIEGTQGTACGREVEAAGCGATSETAHALAEDREINAANVLVAVIDGKHEDARGGGSLALGAVRGAHIKKATVWLGFVRVKRMTCQEGERQGEKEG